MTIPSQMATQNVMSAVTNGIALVILAGSFIASTLSLPGAGSRSTISTPKAPFFEQNAWRHHSRSVARGGVWMLNETSVAVQYAKECNTMEQDAFCVCVLMNMVKMNISQSTNSQKILSMDDRRSMIECQIRDRKEVTQCDKDNSCPVRNINIYSLNYVWSFVSLTLAVNCLIDLAIYNFGTPGWVPNNEWLGKQGGDDKKRGKNMAMALKIIVDVVMMVIFLVTLGTEYDWNTSTGTYQTSIAIYLTYIVCKYGLVIAQSWLDQNINLDFNAFQSTSVCNATYLVTVPISVAMLYASNFQLETMELCTVVVASVIIPLLQLLLSMVKGMEERLLWLSLSSLVMAFGILLPHMTEYISTCWQAKSQYWLGLDTNVIFASTFITCLYPFLELHVTAMVIGRYRGGNGESPSSEASEARSFATTYFFILTDILTRALWISQALQMK